LYTFDGILFLWLATVFFYFIYVSFSVVVPVAELK